MVYLFEYKGRKRGGEGGFDWEYVNRTPPARGGSI